MWLRELGVADHLRITSHSIEELASLTACHPGGLYRLLRALAAIGVFHESENKMFSLTAMGECLRSEFSDTAWRLGSLCRPVLRLADLG